MNPPAAPALRLAVAQTAPVLRDPGRNVRLLLDIARSASADLVLTPELSLTGYDVGDAVHHLATSRAEACGGFAKTGCQIVVGMIEAGAGGPFNTALVVEDGTERFHHRKLYLPTYGMFDEARWFGRGSTLEVWTPLPGWTAGVLVCEDFWHPGLVYVLASRKIDVLLVQAAAPGRGVWEGGAHGAFASADVWTRMARTTAQLYGIYVALSNRTGTEGGVTFAGGSVIVAPDGSIMAHAADDGEAVLEATLTREALQRARTPYAHVRDDDPSLVARELMRGLPS